METYYVIKNVDKTWHPLYSHYIILNSDLEQICGCEVLDESPMGAIGKLFSDFRYEMKQSGKDLSEVNYSFEIPENFKTPKGKKSKRLKFLERRDFKRESKGIFPAFHREFW